MFPHRELHFYLVVVLPKSPLTGAFSRLKIYAMCFFVLNIYMGEQITIADLEALRGIIDLACTRGAFNGSEMFEIGHLYNKLTQFLSVAVMQAEMNETPHGD